MTTFLSIAAISRGRRFPSRSHLALLALAPLFFLLAQGQARAEEPGRNILAETREHLARADLALEKLLAVEGKRTIENTLEAFNEVEIHLDVASQPAGLFAKVHPDSAVRADANKAEQEADQWRTKFSLNHAVYEALQQVDSTLADAETRQMLRRTLRDYRRAGVDKDEETRAKIQVLREEILRIGQEFDRNIIEDVRSITLESAEHLKGLPEDYVKAHPPGPDGRIRITTAYPDFLPFMTYAEDGEARRKIAIEFSRRATPQNIAVLDSLLRKRYELANLLGYTNWAVYITGDKMVGSAEAAAAFIDRLDAATRKRAAEDYRLLLERKRKDDPSATEVADWERSYYSEKVKNEKFSFDSQALRPYFDFPRVQQGILDLTSQLFGVTYRKMPDAPVWAPEVECYEIYEGERLLGRFFLDMHPRKGKYEHAAQFTIRHGVLGRQVPEGVLVCNLPGGDGSGPALMEHDDVETFLHEFGHLLHHLLGGNQRWIDLSGVATEWDFVEAPSLMLEEWAGDAKALQSFARHYETGAPIPADLIAKLRAARDFGNGLWVRQQNFYSKLSLSFHDRNPEGLDTSDLLREIQALYSPWRYVDGTAIQASFGHLNGYSAIYYTYMWSLVIAKDLFSKFPQDDLLDPAVARRYRDTILVPGGTKDAAILVRDFLGRSYDFSAFEKWLNSGAPVAN
jgi:thimet oligopeptidase